MSLAFAYHDRAFPEHDEVTVILEDLARQGLVTAFRVEDGFPPVVTISGLTIEAPSTALARLEEYLSTLPFEVTVRLCIG